MTAPRLVITIDTEGDNAWARPRVATTRNAEYLPRFQELCDQFGFKPTYLTNYEMAQCRRFQQFGRDVLARGAAEIGIEAVEAYLNKKTDDPSRAAAAREAYDAVKGNVRDVSAGEGIKWPYAIPVLPKWNEFSEGTDVQETVQTGRTYIDLTRSYVDRWKALP